MKRNLELPANPRKVFFKLTIIGCFLLAMAYASLVIMNSALQSIH
jgi:hypothetical protein